MNISVKNASVDCSNEETPASSTNKQKNRGRKRKRGDSESSTDVEDILPENALEVEKNLHASAIKNNLDDVSVRKILKKVVTNDHVLALVKLQEEEEEGAVMKDSSPWPKLTRAKAKELMRVSSKSAPWNLELTPIKHIPVKTRPEVKALITKELPEDEDDDEYHPTHDDVQSDEDQTLESCSDLDSQPATPATPGSLTTASPVVVTDGPFKVPQGLQTPVRRKLILEEEATIALRTRSKINLSATPIEHIESSFVPPDEVATPVVDEIWNQFLEECLNPAEVSRNEEDDDADPEYNVAADPDAHDEEEDIIGGPFKISKKELNDLVTELFNVMPDNTDELAENLAKNVLMDTSHEQLSTQWEGKQEPEEEETKITQIIPNKVTEKRDSAIRFSIGKNEPEDDEYIEVRECVERRVHRTPGKGKGKIASKSPPKAVNISVEEQNVVLLETTEENMPPALRNIKSTPTTQLVHVNVDHNTKILPEQILILQQQLRQHIQLAASNFLQFFVHPSHWKLAPTYKEYLEQFNKMVEACPSSVVNVCNLTPASELIHTWESTVSQDTPENKKLVEFIQKEAERSRQRFNSNALYAGEFPEILMKIVANSPVFLYPYLLPAMPYRSDCNRKFGYRPSEDYLIALGLEQFWRYIEANPDLFKRRKNIPQQRTRWGLIHACTLVCKHMLPWLTPKHLLCHIGRARKEKDNPIHKLFLNHEIPAVKHKLLPFNPSLTLYEQPEYEMPRIWARYLAKSSKRFRDYIYKRKNCGKEPDGVPISVNVVQPIKRPLPIDFTQKITANRVYNTEPGEDKVDIEIRSTNLIETQPHVVLINDNGSVNVPDQNTQRVAVNDSLVVKDAASENTSQNGSQTPVVNKTPMLTISAGLITMNNNKENTETNASKKDTNDVLHAGSIVSLKNNLLPNKSVLGNNKTQEASKHLTPLLNMFQIVPTSLGMCLIPLTQNTRTVNSITAPISASQENNNILNQNTLLDEVRKKTDELKNHCECCILLRKLVKRQSKITDFFKKECKSQCHCTGKTYPNISKRLKLLVNNYKKSSWVEQNRVEIMIQNLENMKNDGEQCQVKNEEDYSLEDIAYVTSYQIKLTNRSLLIRNIHTKRRINTLLSVFDTDSDDPLDLADNMCAVLEMELLDLYKEFIGFLTAEQADRLSSFKDYFVLNCMKDLLKKIEQEIKETNKKLALLSYLKGIHTNNKSSSCEICAGILNHLAGYPSLAEYVFSLFPHRTNRKEEYRCQIPKPARLATLPPPQSVYITPNEQIYETLQESSKDPLTTSVEHLETESNEKTDEQNENHTECNELNDEENVIDTGCNELNNEQNVIDTECNQMNDDPNENHAECNQINDEQNENHTEFDDNQGSEMMETDEQELTICDRNAAVDYEADHSSCGEGDEEYNDNNSGTDRRKNVTVELKHETVIYETEITVSKTEVQELSESTVMSPLVMSEDEQVKSEVPEWKREDDKQILEVLLQYLTPEERKDKTILEILEEKSVYHMIAEGLPHKSIDNVKNRVMYLLEILVLSEY